MPSRVKTDADKVAQGNGTPKSFAPQVVDPVNPTAWHQLEGLTKRSTAEPPERADAQDLIALARSNIQARRLRKRHLPSAMFGEPAWDMLLSLYVGYQSGARQTVSNLSYASGAPASTALRWIDYLEQQKLVVRRASPTDRRVIFIDFTEDARQMVEAFLTELLAAGIKPSKAI